jgi:hypothetical protein
MKAISLFLIIISLIMMTSLMAQIFTPNYDETLVPNYVLPKILEFENGDTVESQEEWKQRREEIYRLFEHDVYGKAPKWEGTMTSAVIYENTNALNGQATLREIKLTLHYQGKSLDIFLLLHLPKTPKKTPVFLGYNFYGNHTTTNDPGVMVTPSWSMNSPALGITDNKATETSRGMQGNRWPAKEIVSRGFGLATVYYGDVDPDFDDGFQNGVHQLLGTDSASWGSVAAWAWGLSRVMDYLETYEPVDSEKVAVLGHSRLGKAALWAGVSDERFAMVISNNSGCGGAALSMRQYGETVGRITTNFPHWFAENYKRYNKMEHTLPVDQHQLLALVAPRPLYVASAEDDRWADPKGEFLSSMEASVVYELLGLPGLSIKEMPAVNQPVTDGKIAYHIRTGVHEITLYDWMQYLDFAEKHLQNQ